VIDLAAARARLEQEGPAPGVAWCEAWTDEVDAGLGELAGPVVARARLAVVAIGGYGRRQLCPRSDVDLLLLHDHLGEDDLTAAVRAIVYPLWDAGLKVGYAVRDRREAVDAVEDLETATAMLDARLLVGETRLLPVVRAEALRRLRRRGARFLTGLRDADERRRAGAGAAAEVVEPDLKSGAGGLRDLQSLRWAAAALVGSPGLDPLVASGHLGAEDRPRLVDAERRLLAARVALHLVAGGTETLRLDLQDAVAERLGYVDAEDGIAPLRMLRDLYEAARTIEHAHRRAWRLIDADLAWGTRRRARPAQRRVEGFELADGLLRIPAGADLEAPDLPMRLFSVLVDTGAVLERASAARLRARASAGPVSWSWDQTARRRFVDGLWAGRLALPALAELDDAGMLTAMLPEWRAVRCRPQRNPFHRFALDRHAWHAVAELAELVRREPWAKEALDDVRDPDALLLGVLLHDVGKAHGEPHSETGVPVAAAMARRMGADETTVGTVQQLVRLHLLLPDRARRRDVSDPALAREVAEEIGDTSLLASLHLLAAADGLATGPSAWSSWTASLLGSLVTKVRAVLDDLNPAEVADGAAATHGEARRMARTLGADADDVAAHLDLLPDRYAAALSPRAVVRHTLMCLQPPGPTEVRSRVTPGTQEPGGHEGLDELDVVALDHPGWFALVTGVVALHGGSVVAADAFCRRDGLAVDTFRVRPPEGVTGSTWWAGVEGDLSEVAAGRLAVRARVLRMAAAERRRLERLPEVATRISTEVDPSGTSTVVEVRTLDRLGVLYSIATALAELHLDLVVARVETMGFEAVDVFFVRDAEGRPLDDDHLGELTLAIRSAIDAL
jgi:[protein-PII] uridylyltransferase